MKEGGANSDRLDELHRNVRQVVENVGHLVTKNQVGCLLRPTLWYLYL